MLTVANLQKSFATPDGRVHVVDDVGFNVAEAECYALLGPSGCGKTTTLRCIAGLEQIDGGTIEIGGTVVADAARGIFVPVHERSIGMVFQSYAIWPHFDVLTNVAYPLQVQRPRLRRDEIKSRVMDVLKLVGMEALARRPATRLSGGQQQRVALARAIVRQPALLLLDEPLSNLDARLRESMRKELSDLIARIGITALLVTHDQAEAFAMAHRLAIMDSGRVVQEGTPREVYVRPKNSYIARFLGGANVIDGIIESRAGSLATILLNGSGQRIELESELPIRTKIHLVLRPENLTILSGGAHQSKNEISGKVASVAFQGSNAEYSIDFGGEAPLRVIAPPELEIPRGAAVWIRIDTASATIFETRSP